jgi:carboxyl-terminal processing protease
MTSNCRWRGGALGQGAAPRTATVWRWPGSGVRVTALTCLALLTACGGGGGGGSASDAASVSCSVRDHQEQLQTYMNEWYFWYRLAPQPHPAGYADVSSFFDALLYRGSSADFPADRWSASESVASFERFYQDGESLGFGLSVAGLEVLGQPNQPLYVRGVDPGSPAAVAGVQRGDQVLSLNGRSAADLAGANDFSALTATQVGQVLDLRLLRGSSVLDLRLTSAVFAVTPVTGSQVFTSAQGRRVGYLAVKNMISQALTPIDQAFAQFKAQQVQDLVLDLRYNGGGLVSVGGQLASYVAGLNASGSVYATLLYNDRRAASNNSTFRFDRPAHALGLSRVYLLTGQRTCSASEQLINGLRGVGVQVVAVGDTTCGKPVGFLPNDLCGQTYSVVNFESVNARNEGRYWQGFEATCAVVENFQTAQGSAADPLLAAAAQLADGGSCPAQAQGSSAEGRKSLLAARRQGTRVLLSEERSDMLGR